MVDTPLPGYPSVFGNKNVEVVEHIGPKSYTTGGEVYDAVHLGWGGLDWVVVPIAALAASQGNTYSGTYHVKVVFSTTSAIQGALGSVKLQWFTASAGSEVSSATDLSGEVLRLFAIGI